MYFFDQYSDIDKEPLEKLAAAGVIAKPHENIESLPNRDFALIVLGEKRAHRQFPLNDKENTALSLVYFMKNKDQMGPTCEKIAGARIKEACVKFGLSSDGVLNDYSLGLAPGESHEVSYRTIRKEVMTKAASAPTPAPEPEPIPEPELNPNIIDDMKFRSRNLEPEQQRNYIKVAEVAKAGGITVKEAQAVVGYLDKKYGINQYNRRMTPERVVTKLATPTLTIDEFLEVGIEKKASPADELTSLLASDKRDNLVKELEDQFGKDMTDGLIENPGVIYDSLPRPHQEIIREIIKRLQG